MYDSKRVLISLLVIAGFIKLFQFGTLFYHLLSGYTTSILIATLVFGIYVAVHFFGLSSAIKERPCGLKAFSIQQIIFVVLHIVGLLFLLWGQVSLHHQNSSDSVLDSSEPVDLKKFEQGQDILASNVNNNNVPKPVEAASTTCRWKKYAPIVYLGLYIFITFIDLVTAILSWKGYRQLTASRSAVQTFTDLSETPDNEMMMTPTSNVVPLNVVYVPANLYDPLQTYQ
jgi:uncharacterized membrane protein